MEFSLGILIGLTGLVVILWAFVRPRRGDEPHCRGCRFNLVGLTEPMVCPECGRELARRRSVIKGHRPSPRRAVVWCVGLLLISGALVGLDWMNRTGFFPLTKYKPALVLQAEAYLLGDLRASMATDEIVLRIADGRLGAEAEDRLVATALARHAQTWRAFPDAQWMVITRAMGRNELGFEQIKRVWDDCIAEARIIEAGKNGGAGSFAPGETLQYVIGYESRAGTMRNAGLLNAGFALDTSMTLLFENEAGELETHAKVMTRGSIVQRIPARPNIGLQTENISIRSPILDRVGKHRGVLEYDIAFAHEIVAKAWPGITSDQLDQLATLKHSYRFPIEFEIVEPKVLDVPVVFPESGTEDPGAFIEFTVVRVYSAEENKDKPGAMFRVGSTAALDASIGLGGVLAFTQGDKRVTTPVGYNKPYWSSQQFMVFEGFEPGPVRVRYEHDAYQARLLRDKMTSVLGGPIELGTIEIPGPETPEPD